MTTVRGLAAVAVAGLAIAAPLTHTSTPAWSPSSVTATVSTADGSQQLAPSSVTAVPMLDLAPAITVDPSTTYQTMVGAGAALTDSSAQLLMGLPAAQRDATVRQLFSSSGAGISVLRVVIGASDFATSAYSYSSGPGDFSVAHDETAILPLLREARAVDPSLVIVAAPWSPPAWMKTTGSLDGGSLLTTDETAYAGYLTQFVQAYAADGVRVDAISPQNEPETSSSTYPTSTMTADQEVRVVGDLRRSLDAAGLSTKIVGYDGNWSDPSYAGTLLGSGAPVDAIGFHCYAGDPSSQSLVHQAFPSTVIAVSECSGTTGRSYASDLDWDAQNLMIASITDWASAVLTWNLALDPSDGPHDGGCGTCRGVVTVGPTVTTDVEYAVLGQLDRAAVPGAVRVKSQDPAAGLHSVAFREPDGSFGLFVHAQTASTFDVRDGTRSFRATLPTGAVATYVWHD